MRHRTRRLICLALLLSAFSPHAFRLFAETLTIVTYNVNNYLPATRVVDGTYHQNYPKPEIEKAALRANLKALNADIVAIQEMGGQPLLNELLLDLKHAGLDYPYAELLDNSFDPDRHLAVLSRRPFTLVRKHTDLTFKYFDNAAEPVKRGLLEVHVDTEAGDLALFIVHLKSRLTETDHKDDLESAIRRAGEATAIRDRILKIYPAPSAPDSRFLILGDFNDTRDNRSLRAMSVRGKTQIAAPLPGGDSRGEVWTHFYARQDSYSRHDHIMVSPALKKSVQNNAVMIYDGPDVLTASDHRPVCVRLTLVKRQ